MKQTAVSHGTRNRVKCTKPLEPTHLCKQPYSLLCQLLLLLHNLKISPFMSCYRYSRQVWTLVYASNVPLIEGWCCIWYWSAVQMARHKHRHAKTWWSSYRYFTNIQLIAISSLLYWLDTYELPHFSSPSLAERFALSEQLDHVYYLCRGQPSFAFANFVTAKLLGHSNTTKRLLETCFYLEANYSCLYIESISSCQGCLRLLFMISPTPSSWHPVQLSWRCWGEIPLLSELICSVLKG